MTNVSTLIGGDATAQVTKLKEGIQDLTRKLPKSAEDLGASAYAIFSAGVTDTSKALTVLENSTKLAVAGLGTTAAFRAIRDSPTSRLYLRSRQ